MNQWLGQDMERISNTESRHTTWGLNYSMEQTGSFLSVTMHHYAMSGSNNMEFERRWFQQMFSSQLPFPFLSKEVYFGAPGWLSQLSSDFGSRHDLAVHEFELHVRLSAVRFRALSLLQILCLLISLCPSPLTLCLSFKNKYTLKKNWKKKRSIHYFHRERRLPKRFQVQLDGKRDEPCLEGVLERIGVRPHKYTLHVLWVSFME